MPTVKQCTIRRSFQQKTCCPSIHQLTCHLDTPPINAISPMVSSVTPMSWTPGPPLLCHRRSRANGKMMPICSDESSRWICVRKHTTSFVRGCSAQSCVQTLNTIHCRGKTPHCQVGFSIPIAKKCQSQRATSSLPSTCLKNLALMPCVIGQHQLDLELTLHSARTK